MKSKRHFLVWIAFLALPFLVQRGLAAFPEWVENIYVRQVFPVISAPLRSLSSIPPISLTELVTVAAPFLLLLLVFLTIRAQRRNRLKPFLVALTGKLAWILTVAAWLFILMHGLNYVREPVAVSFALPVQQRSSTELAAAARWVIGQAQVARETCQEDQDGVFTLSATLDDTLRQARVGYQAAARTWPLLAGAIARPKGVLLSHYWSYTGITGLYMPLWVEANVNIDQPDHQVPATVNHELAHTIGFAREDEAGFVGFLAGIASPYADYRYSSYADATVRVLNSLSAVDPKAYAEVAAEVPDSIWRDIQAANDYWQQFEGPVQETSTQINHAYLKANLQSDGVHSYGRMVDLLLAWYEQNSEHQTLPEALP